MLHASCHAVLLVREDSLEDGLAVQWSSRRLARASYCSRAWARMRKTAPSSSSLVRPTSPSIHGRGRNSFPCRAPRKARRWQRSCHCPWCRSPLGASPVRDHWRTSSESTGWWGPFPGGRRLSTSRAPPAAAESFCRAGADTVPGTARGSPQSRDTRARGYGS